MSLLLLVRDALTHDEPMAALAAAPTAAWTVEAVELANVLRATSVMSQLERRRREQVLALPGALELVKQLLRSSSVSDHDLGAQLSRQQPWNAEVEALLAARHILRRPACRGPVEFFEQAASNATISLSDQEFAPVMLGELKGMTALELGWSAAHLVRAAKKWGWTRGGSHAERVILATLEHAHRPTLLHVLEAAKVPIPLDASHAWVRDYWDYVVDPEDDSLEPDEEPIESQVFRRPVPSGQPVPPSAANGVLAALEAVEQQAPASGVVMPAALRALFVEATDEALRRALYGLGVDLLEPGLAATFDAPALLFASDASGDRFAVTPEGTILKVLYEDDRIEPVGADVCAWLETLIAANAPSDEASRVRAVLRSL